MISQSIVFRNFKVHIKVLCSSSEEESVQDINDESEPAKKRQRAEPLTSFERNLLLELIDSEKIIESKRTDTETARVNER